MKNPATDVIYYKYPSGDFDSAEKPQAVPILPQGNAEPTQTGSAYADSAPQAVTVLPQRSSLMQLGVQLFFNGVNAVLGIGAACSLIPLVAVSVALIPFCGLGFVMFQLTAALVVLFTHLDVALANLVAPSSPKLSVDSKIQCGICSSVGDRSFCGQLMYVSPKLLGVMLYFILPKLLVGILSFLAVSFTFVMPIESLATGGHDGMFWNLDYEDGRGTYMLRFVLCWLLGALCFALVPKLSVKATTWACVGSENTSIPSPGSSPQDLEAVVVLTPRIMKTAV